jgi:hypothetical protein
MDMMIRMFVVALNIIQNKVITMSNYFIFATHVKTFYPAFQCQTGGQTFEATLVLKHFSSAASVMASKWSGAEPKEKGPHL